MSKLGIFQNMFKNLRIGNIFKDLPLFLYQVERKLSREEEADKAARDFTASIASAYRLSTSKVTLSGLNNAFPGLDPLLGKWVLRNLWHENKDAACGTAVGWVRKQSDDDP
jgi:hypothetical protein